MSLLGKDKRLLGWIDVRIKVVSVFFGCFILVLWIRAFYIQVIWRGDLLKKVSSQYWQTKLAFGNRGEIFSRGKVVLAKSVVLRSVFANPTQIMDARKVADRVSRILNIKRERVYSLLKSRRHFVWIARKIGDREAHLLKEEDLRGIYLTEERSRVYPQGSMAGQLLGFVGIDNHGLEGLEKSFDSYLSGEKQYFKVQRDGKGNILYAPGELTRGRAGKDLILTLDSRIQAITEDALEQGVLENKAKWGGALVVDVPTGQILAWAQYPFFNPNDYRTSSPLIWRNRIALDQFEPGSTIKPLLVASALEERIFKPSSILFCENGRWRFKDVVIRDTHRHKWLSIAKIVRYSSNIGAAKIALKLGPQKLYAYFHSLGLGVPTGLPLPGEARGFIPEPSTWGPVDLAISGFGQGFSVTMLQLAQAYLTIANLGIRVPLCLTISPEEIIAPRTRVFSKEVSIEVLKMLRDVVEKDGTGIYARIKGVEIGGKTGTSQKASPTGGYSKDKYVSSFVGLMPAMHPKFLALVVVDEPQRDIYGGIVSAPVVKKIFEHLLAYKGNPALLPSSEKNGGLSPHLSLDKGNPVSISKPGKAIPDFRGMCLRQALEILAIKHIVPEIRGKGVWIGKQYPSPGAKWQRNITLWLKEEGP